MFLFTSMSNIVKFYYHQLYKNIIYYTLGTLATLIIFMAMYPSFKSAGDTFVIMLESIPQSLLATVGLNINTMNSILGYYAFTLSYVMLIYGVFAIYVGMYLNGYESSRQINEYLYVKPVKRINMFFAKILTGIFAILTSFTFYLIGSYLILSLLSDTDVDFNMFMKLSFSLLMFLMTLYSLGFLCGVIFKNVKQVGSFATLTTVLLFFLNFISSLIEEDFGKFISPFGVYNASGMFESSNFNEAMIYSVIVFVLFIMVACAKFLRREV